MENELLVSIIVPVYNVEKYIERCIESIINQTYKNLEIILVDDGSIDKSINICKKYSKIDNRIVIIEQENKGVSSARNTGIKNSHGDFIGFVDPDDFIEPNMYKILINNVLKYNCNVGVCGVRNIEDITGKLIEETIQQEDKILNNEEFWKKLLNGKDMPSSVWNKIFKRDIIKDIMFDENMKIGEDFKWIFEVFRRNKELLVYNTTEILYNWIKRQSSAIQGKKYNIDIEKSIELTYEIGEFIKNTYPEIYIYSIKCSIYANLQAIGHCKNKQDKKKIKKRINKLKLIFLKAKEIEKKDKIKFIIKFYLTIVYKIILKFKLYRK